MCQRNLTECDIDMELGVCAQRELLITALTRFLTARNL